jgi:hypothetical protein
MFNTEPSATLVDALADQFGETELHAIATAAEQQENREMPWARRLSKAARRAAGRTCTDCRKEG